MTIRLPMLASDWEIEKIKFPCILQPKIDGVRGVHPEGGFVGRSFKSFKNEFTTAFYSIPEFEGLDGEVAAQHQCHPRLCNLTTSALNTIEGEPFTLWWVFDYITPKTIDLEYEVRLATLYDYVRSLQDTCPQASRLRLIPFVFVESLEQLMHWHSVWRAEGYEGSIIRDPRGKYKNGRSTPTEGGLLRVKDFADAEATITGVKEGQTNNNVAKVNELGYTERSTHQANMVGHGKIGTLYGTLLQDAIVNGGTKTIPKGSAVTVSPGCMTHDARERYLANPELIVGLTMKFQHFPHGVKDKLRMSTFQSFRMAEDMS